MPWATRAAGIAATMYTTAVPEPTSAAMSGAVTMIEYHGAVADRARAVPWAMLRRG